MKTVKIFTSITMIGLFFILVHCGGSTSSENGPDPQPNPQFTGKRTLSQYESCEALLSDLKAGAKKQVEETMVPENFAYCGYIIEETDGLPSPMEETDDAQDSPDGVDFTDTNLQEAEVDEPDIIKTDGEYIFVAVSNGVDIFRAWPANELNRIKTITLDPWPDTKTSAYGSTPKIFLVSDKLVILDTATPDNFHEGNVPQFDFFPVILGKNSISRTRVSIYDVGNPSAPELIVTRIIDGLFLDARLTGGILQLSVESSLSFAKDYVYPEIDDDLQTSLCSDNLAVKTKADQQLAQRVGDALNKNLELIGASTVNDWLPQIGDGKNSSPVSCDAMLTDGDSASGTLLGQYSLNISSTAHEDQITFVKGMAYTLYASTRSVYLAGSEYDSDNPAETTSVHRFEINPASGLLHRYAGSGSVPGSILNQFSMGEYGDSFRIATTVGHVSPDGATEVFSNVYLLDAAKTDLPVTGKIEQIEPGEQIYAARFIGTKGYLVTFKKIDPLLVVDLADTSHPKIAGKLEMPGFSTYLHPLDENHLIGLGKGAEDMGDFAWFQGLKLAVFDVSNPTSPEQSSNLEIGSRGTDSSALNDHHAFTFDAKSGTLALPVSYYEGGKGASNYGTFQYSGVHLYTISAEKGIQSKAIIKLPTEKANNWWFQSSPSRTILMSRETQEVIYILDDSKLYSFDLQNPAVMAGSAQLSR